MILDCSGPTQDPQTGYADCPYLPGVEGTDDDCEECRRGRDAFVDLLVDVRRGK